MHKPVLAIILAVATAVSVLVLDPMGLIGPDFEFDATHMRAAIEGTWKLTFTNEAGQTKTIKLSIRQAGAAEQHGGRAAVRESRACGNRTMVRSAAACVDSSSMPLEIVVLEGDAQAATGRFMVTGTTFTAGHLDINFGAEIDYTKPMTFVGAQISPTGAVLDAGAGPGVRVALVRTAPSPTTAAAPR
jgi:hypothetical protein